MARWGWSEEQEYQGWTPKSPIVVWCRHGTKDGEATFVQRFSYEASTNRWRASDTTAEGVTFIGSDGQSPSRRPALFDDAREHFNARCKICRDNVPMSGQRAQVALNRLSDLGMNNPDISVLRTAYKQVAT